MCQALLAQGVTQDDSICFGDEFRVGLYDSKRRVLAPRGVKVRQKVEFVRDWYDLAVVVDGREGRLEWCWIEALRSEQIAAVVQDWRDKGVDALVWDRRTSHHAAAVREVGVALIEQPPVSPELNPTELIGQMIRRETDGHIYGTIWRKMAAVESVLKHLAENPEQVRRLIGWDWVLQSYSNLPNQPIGSG
jgi:hypothetical protein